MVLVYGGFFALQPPSGKQDHGLPPTSNTKAVGAPYGVLGPAPIYALDRRKSEIERKCKCTFPERRVRVFDCISRLILIEISKTKSVK